MTICKQYFLTLLQKFLHRINGNYHDAKPYLFRLGLILIFAYTGFYVLNLLFLYPKGYENFTMRMLISLLGVLCLIQDKLPQHMKKYFPWLFHFIICFSFPFFFSFMLFHNQNSHIWQVNGLVGFVLLSFFVDWVTFILLSCIGFSAAYILTIISNGSFIFNQELISIFLSYTPPAIYFIVFSQKREDMQKIQKMYHNKIDALNKSLENQVSERTLELNKALAVKNEFLNNISHEIRTPIMAFSMAASALTEHWDDLSEKDKFKMADNVAKSAQRIKNLSMHLIAATKLQEGARVLNLQEISLSNLINNFIDEAIALYTKEKNIKIKFDAPCDYIIKADPESFTQILRNLVTNAIKYSPKNSTISITFQEEGQSQVRIAVSDEGVGIPTDELEEIFTPFGQSSRTKTGAGGVGLGLDIARKIVEVHGGKIWAENNDKKGASFCVSIGFIDSTVDLTRARGKTILIIDDEELLLESMQLKLISLRAKVLTAIGGKAGLELIAKKHKNLDAIVLDIMMPDINGIEVLQQIKELYPELKVIMHSGVASAHEIKEVMHLGAHHFLSKPYDIKELIKHL